MGYSKDEVKNNLDIEHIYALLDYFNAEPEIVDDYIICKTVCHCGDSKKLYYYDNTQLFNCYTECGSFDIFDFIQKVKSLDDLNVAVNFVVNFFNLQYKLSDIEIAEATIEDWKILNSRITQEDLQDIGIKQLRSCFYD